MDRTHFCWSYALTLPVFVLMTCSDIIWRHRMYHLNQILPNKGNCILSEFHYHLELKNYAFGCLCFLVWFVKFCSSIWDTNSENTQLLCFIFIFYYFEMFRWYTVLNWFKFFNLSSSFNFVLSLLLIYLFIYVFFFIPKHHLYPPGMRSVCFRKRQPRPLPRSWVTRLVLMPGSSFGASVTLTNVCLPVLTFHVEFLEEWPQSRKKMFSSPPPRHALMYSWVCHPTLNFSLSHTCFSILSISLIQCSWI